MNIVPTQYKVIFIINTYIYMSDEDEKTLTDMVYNEWYQKLFYDSGRCTIGQGGLSKRIRFFFRVGCAVAIVRQFSRRSLFAIIQFVV